MDLVLHGLCLDIRRLCSEIQVPSYLEAPSAYLAANKLLRDGVLIRL